MSRTIVVGAGLSGLARAHALARRGDDVVVLEASDRAGGVVRTVTKDGYLLEMGPNTVRPTPELWSLVHELGLERDAVLADPRLPRFIDFRGRLHPLPMSPAAFARSKLLSASGKLRLLREPLVGRGPANESVRSFFTRRLGPEVAERFVEPFVSGIWAGDAARLEMASAFPSLSRFERDHGSILAGAVSARRRKPKPAGPRPPRGLLSFREGLDTLPRSLAGALGGRVRLGVRVEEISRRGGSWVVSAGRDTLTADRLVLATPAFEAARLVRGADAAAADALSAIPHPPLVVLHLSWPERAFARPLSGFGQLVAPDPSRRILGAVWSSSLFSGRAPRGAALLTAFLGGARDPEAASMTDERLVERAARDLSESLAIRGAPDAVSITRHARALPQYEIGHAERIGALARAEARLPGLTFLGNYRGGISVGDVVANAVQEP